MLGEDVCVMVDKAARLGGDFWKASACGETEKGDWIAYFAGRPGKVLRGCLAASFRLDGRTMLVAAPYGARLLMPDIAGAFPGAEDITSLYEKSCGAIVYVRGAEPRYVLVENRRANWGFPKGHVEANESEHDTAAREIFEETGLRPDFVDGFRETVSYNVSETVRKTAVYYLAATDQTHVVIPRGEISSWRLLKYGEALQRLSFDSERALLKKAAEHIAGMENRLSV